MPGRTKWRKKLQRGLQFLWIVGMILGMVVGMVAAERSEAAALPPLGERLYCPTSDGRIAIVSAAQAKVAGQRGCFRDPSRGGQRIRQRQQERPASALQPVRSQRPRPAAMVQNSRSDIELAPLEINGKVREPRLPFALAPLPLPRADEPISPEVASEGWDQLIPEPSEAKP